MNKYWDWKLFGAVFAYMLVPALYKSYGLALLGFSSETTQNLAIASQWQFMQVVLEVFQEALILPVFYFVGSAIDKTTTAAQRVKTSLALLVAAQGLISVVAFVGVSYFIDLTGTPQAIVKATESYLRLMVWSSFLSVITFGMGVMLQSLNASRSLVILLILKLIFSICLDSIFIGPFAFSLQLGAWGASLSSLLSEALVTGVGSILVLRRLRLSIRNFIRLPVISDIRLFSNLSVWIALDSTVRNVVYFAIVLRIINQLGESAISGYYIVMHIFWSFFLIPLLALSDTARAIGGNHASDVFALRSITRQAIYIATPFCVVFVVTGLWPSAIVSAFTNNVEVLETANMSMRMLSLPYAFLGLNIVLDSVFYAVGKTKYLALQSIITNVIVYGPAFVMLRNDWEPTLTSVLGIFAVGILVDTALTVFFLLRVLRTAR